MNDCQSSRAPLLLCPYFNFSGSVDFPEEENCGPEDIFMALYTLITSSRYFYHGFIFVANLTCYQKFAGNKLPCCFNVKILSYSGSYMFS